MDPFWSKVYDSGKDRRYGALFFTTMFLLFGILAVSGMFAVLANGNPEEVFGALVTMVIIFSGAFAIAILRWNRWRKLQRQQLKYSTLSRDELAKARSKLKKQMNGVRFRQVSRPVKQKPRARAPDTDLKY